MSIEVNKCDGNCHEDEGHVGEVVRVRVSSEAWKAMEFNYCQAAIEEDKRRGFNVEILNVETKATE